MHQPVLIDDRVDLDLRQVVDGPAPRASPGPPSAARSRWRLQLEVVDQAVLERRVGLLDRLGGVEPVDPPTQRQDDPEDARTTAAADQPEGQHDPPKPDRQADRAWSSTTSRNSTPRNRDQQDQARRQDVGDLDPRPGPAELVIDELLVIQQLAVQLRARSHEPLLPRCRPDTPHPEPSLSRLETLPARIRSGSLGKAPQLYGG